MTTGFRITASVFLLLPLLAGGCTQVAFHQKAKLSTPMMSMDDDRMETHLHQKVYYSREGSAGGIGAGAGGGCGCY